MNDNVNQDVRELDLGSIHDIQYHENNTLKAICVEEKTNNYCLYQFDCTGDFCEMVKISDGKVIKKVKAPVSKLVVKTGNIKAGFCRLYRL